MSIATLKRKTAQKYNCMSVNQPQFSLNGGYRSQGWVGQTTLSRSLPRTLMQGNTPRGHGGCCGTYVVTPIVQSAVLSENNSQVIKSSVLDNEGMIATKYRWIRRPQPYTSVKPDATLNLNRQSDYIDRLSRQQVCSTCIPVISPSSDPPKQCDCNNMPNIFKSRINTPQSFAAPYPVTFTKPETTLVAANQSDYVTACGGCCTSIDIAHQNLLNQTSSQKTPFSCGQ